MLSADLLEDFLYVENQISSSISIKPRWIQMILNVVEGENLHIDGIIGSKTKNAIKRFQTKYSLIVDGKIGSQTKTALIQKSLNWIRQANVVPINGIFDKRTREEIYFFQSDNGITPTGHIGPQTTTALISLITPISPLGSQIRLYEEPKKIICSAKLQRRWSDWSKLISFRPPSNVQLSIPERKRMGRQFRNAPWFFHKIESAQGSKINLDYYPVVISKLPIINENQLSAEELLEYFRININKFNSKGILFRPYNDFHKRKWISSRPLNTVISIKIPINEGSVIVSEHTSNHWIFTTLSTPADFAHPVSGNREFGFFESGGCYTFYTKAADRITDLLESFWPSKVFSETNALWKNVQSKLAEFVNSNNGVAVVKTPISKRRLWNNISKKYYHPTQSWLGKRAI